MNSWPIVQPILGSFFLIGCLTLPVLIFYLAVEKKKLSEYSKDLIKYGKIKKKHNYLKDFYDVLIIGNALIPIMSPEKHPVLLTNKEITSLIKKVRILEKITLRLFLFFLINSLTLIIILNTID